MPRRPVHPRLPPALFAAAALLLTAAPLAGQRAGEPPLTVADAVALARRHHPTLAAASARRRTAVGLARQDAAMPNPVLEWRRENLGSPLAPDIFVTVRQPVGLTGRRLALRAEVRDVDARAAAESVSVARHVEAEAARAFWRASLARALADVAAAQRADAERLAGVEEARAREGMVAELSAMRAGIEGDRARLAEATARAEFARASAELARALGVAAGTLPPVAPLSPVPPPGTQLPPVDATIAAALERRSEAAALRAGVEAARHRRAAARRGSIGDVALEAGTKWTAGYSTRTLAIAMPLPLLDRNAGGRERATGGLLLANAELRSGEQAVRAEVATAVEALRALLDAHTPAADSLAVRADEVARVADAAYAAGGGTLLELLDARRARAEALTAALRRAAELRLARLELNRASGAPLLDSVEAP